MRASTAPTPEKKTTEPMFSRGFVIFVVIMVALAAATYAFVFFDSKPVKMEPIWTGTGTVISQQAVQGSRKVSEDCFRFCSYESTTSWQLTIREDSGAITNVPVTKREFDALSPGQKFTRK